MTPGGRLQGLVRESEAKKGAHLPCWSFSPIYGFSLFCILRFPWLWFGRLLFEFYVWKDVAVSNILCLLICFMTNNRVHFDCTPFLLYLLTKKSNFVVSSILCLTPLENTFWTTGISHTEIVESQNLPPNALWMETQLETIIAWRMLWWKNRLRLSKTSIDYMTT